MTIERIFLASQPGGALVEFPQIRVLRQSERRGASPTKHQAALEADGEVLVFLDGHTKPEYGSLVRLVQDVEDLAGKAIVTPRIAALNIQRWQNEFTQNVVWYRQTVLRRKPQTTPGQPARTVRFQAASARARAWSSEDSASAWCAVGS